MKRSLYLIIMLVAISFSSMAQTIGDAFYIYRNDGEFNAFFRDEVDSIVYSNYDVDSIYYDEIITQLAYTADSIYRIPLAAIDSVGFVQPETIYREDTNPLVGVLLDYLIKADSMLLTFSSSMPVDLVPNIGDKIVTTELTDKLPNGFTGVVRLVENGSDGIDVYCDSLALEEAVSQYYGVFELVSKDGNSVRRYMNRKAPEVTHDRPLYFDIPQITIPVSLDGIFTPRDAFGIGGKASWTIGIKPTVTGRVVRVVDDRTHISYINLHAVADVKTSHTIEIAGVLKRDHDNFPALRNFWFHKDIPTPWGIPVYVAIGPLVEASGELAVGTTVYADFRHTVDVTFYPATLPYYMLSMNPLIRTLFQNAVESVNTVEHRVVPTNVDADWGYFAARGGIKVGGAARLGLSVGKHEVAWLGVEGQIGLRADAEINVDFDGIADAEDGTAFYDALKSNCNLTINPYRGFQVVVSGLDDHIQLKAGPDNGTILGMEWQRDFLPIFSDTKAVAQGTTADISTNITNDCLIPYTVGFSLFDENNKRVGEPKWNGQKYRLHKDFNLPLETTFTDLATDKKYKVYPTLRLLGINVLASPSTNIDTHFPVTLSDFKVTKKQYEKGAFSHEDVNYDYRFDVSVTATLDNNAIGITEWGYVHLDPNGRETFIPLNKFGRTYTDTRYAYFRNGTPPFTCTLYSYVKYVDSNEPVYGEPQDFPLDYQEDICPDENHPHWIDLGLPSGTLWKCCNEGASSPDDIGTNYNPMNPDYLWPTEDDYYELLENTIQETGEYNGIKGKYFKNNKKSIFLPFAGFRGPISWGLFEGKVIGDYYLSIDYDGGLYISSTQRPAKWFGQEIRDQILTSVLRIESGNTQYSINFDVYGCLYLGGFYVRNIKR